jgi:hypothetical protein
LQKFRKIVDVMVAAEDIRAGTDAGTIAETVGKGAIDPLSQQFQTFFAKDRKSLFRSQKNRLPGKELVSHRT